MNSLRTLKQEIRGALLEAAKGPLEKLGLRRQGMVYVLETRVAIIRFSIEFHRRVTRAPLQVRGVLELVNWAESEGLGVTFSVESGGYVDEVTFIGPTGRQLERWWNVSSENLHKVAQDLRRALAVDAPKSVEAMKRARPRVTRASDRREILAKVEQALVAPATKAGVPFDVSQLVEVEHVGLELSPRLVRKWHASKRRTTVSRSGGRSKPRG